MNCSYHLPPVVYDSFSTSFCIDSNLKQSATWGLFPSNMTTCFVCLCVSFSIFGIFNMSLSPRSLFFDRICCHCRRRRRRRLCRSRQCHIHCHHCHYYKLAGHPLRGWPARLRGHKRSGLWKVWTVPSPPLPSPPIPRPALPSPSPALPCPALPAPPLPAPPLPSLPSPPSPPSLPSSLPPACPAVWPRHVAETAVSRY